MYTSYRLMCNGRRMPISAINNARRPTPVGPLPPSQTMIASTLNGNISAGTNALRKCIHWISDGTYVTLSRKYRKKQMTYARQSTAVSLRTIDGYGLSEWELTRMKSCRTKTLTHPIPFIRIKDSTVVKSQRYIYYTLNPNCTVSQKKTSSSFLRHNFSSCWLVFKIISLMDSAVNSQQNPCHISRRTLSASLHYLVKYNRSKIAKKYDIINTITRLLLTFTKLWI